MNELPIDSIRELIANAVVHRSYLEPSKVQVALYDDRLEITSPGMLIGGLSIADLKVGCCQARNRGIVSAFTYMKIIEQWGSGIPRLMENCKSAGLREPELLEIGGSFRVNMFRNTELLSETISITQASPKMLPKPPKLLPKPPKMLPKPPKMLPKPPKLLPKLSKMSC